MFIELILVGGILFFLHNRSRERDARSLEAHIRQLEKAVREISAHIGVVPRGDSERVEAAAAPAGAEEAVLATAFINTAEFAEAEATDLEIAPMGAVAERPVTPEEAVLATASMNAADELPVASEEESAAKALQDVYAAVYGVDAYPEAVLPLKADTGEESVPPAPAEAIVAEPEAAAEPDSAFEPEAVSEKDPFAEPPHEDWDSAHAEERSERAAFSWEDAPAFLHALVAFIRGGNIWVAGGVIMLLLGFAFLAQLGVFPIEIRIFGAALAGMAMVGFGLHIRLRRQMYALVIQGGGIGVLYLSAFASAKLTDMLPTAAALGIMTALIIPAVTLAVLQNSQILALFGFLGGFAAPILLSDGSGNYVALFSCYTLLNIGILAICRYRLWRWLNFSGALCTFVVMGYWGITSYDVSMFRTTEPFLLAFSLIYVVITLGAVRRDEFSFREPLDAIPACAIPFLAALFQWRIAIDLPHGLSISALAFGGFFIFLAIGVWKLWGERTRRLAEFYLANGVVLANLAVPLEFSGYMTSTIWSVEGAILFFFACRMRSGRIKAVALLLQLVGMAAFFREISTDMGHTLLSTSLVSLAAMSSACFQKLDAADPGRETPEAINAWLEDTRLERFLAVLGLFWWYGGLVLETSRYADQPLVMFFLAASVSSVGFYFAEKVTGLREFLWAGTIAPLVTALCCLLVASGEDFLSRSSATGYFWYFSGWRFLDLGTALLLRHNYLTGWGVAAWAAFAVTQIGMLRLSLARLKPSCHAWWAGIVALELLFMLTSSGRGAALDFGFSSAWGNLASIFPALVYTAVLTWVIQRHTEERSAGFSADHAHILGGTVPAILFVPLGSWLFFSFFSLGNPAPLPVYVPVLNPLELQQALCIATFAMWQRAISQVDDIRFTMPLPRLLLLVDALLFIWLHSMLFRAIAHFTGTPMGRAWEHGSFQVLLTVLWGVWGMSHLIMGNRKRLRLLWVIGTSLMLADTAKLFLVDLADKGTLFRVISFFVMGGIFLLIGWLAPLPPSSKNAAPGSPEDFPEGSLDEPDDKFEDEARPHEVHNV